MDGSTGAAFLSPLSCTFIQLCVYSATNCFVASASLLVSFLTFLTTIWGEGIVFTWLINLTGISALLVWGSIGFVSLRFRSAWRAQNRNLDDLPYTQPLFPVLPLAVVILAILMFIAQGYSAVVEEPFEAKNVVATYIGVGVYILLYLGYSIYDRFVLKSPYHFVPIDEVDLDTDAVWKEGEGALIRQREREESQRKEEAEGSSYATLNWIRRMRKHVDYL